MKAAKRFGLGKRGWHTVAGMFRFADSLNKRDRAALLDRIERWTGPIDTDSAIAMGYVAKDGRWLSDPGERKHRVKEMAAEREARERVAGEQGA